MKYEKNVNVQIAHIPWAIYLIKGTITLLILTVALWGGKKLFCTLVPPLPVLDEARREVARLAVVRGVDALRTASGDIHSVALLHLANDPSNEVTEMLRTALDAQGGLTLQTERLSDRLQALCWIVNHGSASREAALARVNGDKSLDGVIWGKINRLENLTDGSICEGTIELYDLRNERVVYAGGLKASTLPQEDASTKDPIYAGNPQFANMAWGLRVLWFALVALLLPVLSMLFLRSMVAKRSNKVNAGVLLFYTGIDTLLALVLFGGIPTSNAAILGFLLLITFGFIYNALMMNLALRLEGN